MLRKNGTVLYTVFISPDKKFGELRPAFEAMLRTLQVKWRSLGWWFGMMFRRVLRSP